MSVSLRGEADLQAFAITNIGVLAIMSGDFERVRGVAGELGHAFVIRGGALGLAALSVSEAHEHAARLLGAEARIRKEMGIELDAHEEGVRQRTIAEAQAALGEEVFASASANGAATTLEEIVELYRQPR